MSDLTPGSVLPSIQIEHSGSLLPVMVRHIWDRIDWQPMWDALWPYDSVRAQVAPRWILIRCTESAEDPAILHD